MKRVVIGSRGTKLEFVCVEHRGDGRVELIRASVRGPGIEADRDVYEHGGYGGLATFFEELARSWRGWSGDKTFASLEGDLEIVAVHDGHVQLTVRLRQPGPGDWSVTATVTIDPGEELSAAARSVRALVGSAERG